MRVFCAIRHSTDPKHFYGGLWSGNFYPALRDLGHEVIESQVDLLPASRFMEVANSFTPEESAVRTQTTEQILDEVRGAHRTKPIDLFLSYFYNSHFDPAGFSEVRQLGIPSVNFYCNSIYQFSLVAAVAAKADYAWHTEKHARASYLAAGANPVWVQLGADHNTYHPVSGIARVPKACFVGQRYADRDRWLVELIRNNVPVDIYGNGWELANQRPVELPTAANDLGRKRLLPGKLASYWKSTRETLRNQGLAQGCRRLVSQALYRHETKAIATQLAPNVKGRAKEISSVFAGYEVCLNFSNVWIDGRPGSNLIPHVRLRDFEGPMCRTCYLTGHTDEIADCYEQGKEIDTYQSPAELVDKSRFYLAHPDAAEKLREAGHRRALRDHTWKRRFEELFAKIGLNN